MANGEWSFRGLLSPVITRSLIFGVNPIDLEFALASIETGKILNARFLEKAWRSVWEAKADKYQQIAENASNQDCALTARELYLFAARCMFCTYLINFSNIEDKKAVYLRCASLYGLSVSYHNPPVERVEIPLGTGKVLLAYLHLPQSDRKNACAVVYSGLGSCKEEMDTLARALAERGIAALVPDMPGCGESLFIHDLKCTMPNLKSAFSAAVNFLLNRKDVNPERIGTVGLCMGGGYAYLAASLDPRHAFCANLFPLIVSDVDGSVVPQWMKGGDWFNYQTGNVADVEFLKNMSLPPDIAPSCPYFLAYGTQDNWMGSEKVLEMFNRVKHSDKQQVRIDEKPVFSTGQNVTHTMPVGEQMHWVRRIMADWIARRCL